MTATSPSSLGAGLRRSSFYAGMKMLPRAEREAMFAIYGFCRAVDDIADDVHRPRPDRAAELEAWRHDVAALYTGGSPGQAAELADPVARFGLRHEDLIAVIDGMAMDVAGDIRWPPMPELELYCDRVACAVGRLSVRVFGMDEAPGLALAHHLGHALQLTNILRDIDEDAAIGRVYLPHEALIEAGVPISVPEAVVTDPRIDAACRIVAAKAREHHRAAAALLASRPRGHLIAPRLMSAAYAPLLDRMERTGWAPPRSRPSTNKVALLFTALRLWLTR